MKRTPKKPLALVDLDGTLADFDGAMQRELGKLRGPGEDPGLEEAKYEDLPHMTARRRLIKNQPGFWRNLAHLPLGMNIVQILREEGCKIHVLTKGPKHAPNAWSEKFAWCQEHLPSTPVTIADDKSMVYGKILVDDWPGYFDAWRRVRPHGIVIVPAQPWNANYACYDDRCIRVGVYTTGLYDLLHDVVHNRLSAKP